MKKAAARLRKREAESWSIENGRVMADVKAEEGQSLLVTIPLDRGWKITVNGSSRDADVFAGTLVSIPLDPGDNHVEMTYEVPYLKLGALITLIGILLLALTGIAEALLGRKKGESFPALIKNERESARN